MLFLLFLASLDLAVTLPPHNDARLKCNLILFLANHLHVVMTCWHFNVIFILAVISGHYYAACFVVVLTIVVLAVIYLGNLKNCYVM